MTTRKDRFIIVCPARSGSTMLVHLVRSHPDTVSNGEVMAMTDSLGGFDIAVRADLATFGDVESLIRWRRRDPIGFMETVAFHGGGAAMVGFKIKSDELVRRRYRSLLDALRADAAIKVLHLNRENLLERYVSWVMATRVTGVTMAVREDQVPEFQAVPIDPRSCEDDFVTAEKRRALVDRWFADHDVLELAYEAIVADPALESGRICDFLGLERRDLATRTLKLAPHVSTLISNFEELAEHFAGTRWEHLFAPAPDGPVPQIGTAGRPRPANVGHPSSDALTPREPAPTRMFRVPQDVRGIEGRWGERGSPFAVYLASFVDLADLSATRILAIGSHTDMLEAIASGTCDVAAYVGLERSERYVRYCEERLADPRVALHHVDMEAEADLDRIWPEVDPFDLALVRPKGEELGEPHLEAMLDWLRERAADHARLVLVAPLLERSSNGVGVADRFFGDLVDAVVAEDGRMLLESAFPPFAVTVYTRRHLRNLLDRTGWRLDEVREPRRTLQHHVLCTVVG